MNYVISDIHGCYDKYIQIIEKIKFCDEDTLYILGDVVDRGPNGMKVLLDIADRSNVIMFRGNHDEEALLLLMNLYQLFQDEVSGKLVQVYQDWLGDGGNTTLNEYEQLDEEKQIKALNVIRTSLFYKEIKVNGTTYFMSHTVPEKEKFLKFSKCTTDDFVMGEPDYEKVYSRDKVIITGHTPTSFIDEKSSGRIWMRNKHIAIDCGAVFKHPLGCLCLDTMEQFYTDV